MIYSLGMGDWEMASSHGENDVCSSPIGSEARMFSVDGSTEVTHITNDGFWCLNEEQTGGTECADFESRFCCPTPVKARISFDLTFSICLKKIYNKDHKNKCTVSVQIELSWDFCLNVAATLLPENIHTNGRGLISVSQNFL